MKILYVASKPDWGGATVVLYHIIKQLYSKHEIIVVVPTNSGRLIDELHILGVQIYIINYELNIYYKSFNIVKSILISFRRLLRTYKARKKFEHLVSVLKPDVVHCNVGPIDISLDVCLKFGIPHIWHMREYQNLDFNMTFIPSRNFFLKRIHKEGNYNIAITKDVYEHWRLRKEIDVVIYDPVVEEPPFVCQQKKSNYFLFVGRIEESKGLYDVLVAFSLFHKENDKFYLKIVGDYNTSSRYYMKCVKLIQKEGLESFVFWEGHRNDVFLFMQKAVAQIVASRCEGFGLITAEAMFNKCLVIGKNNAGTKEQLDNGVKITGSEIGLRFENTKELLDCMRIAVSCDFSEMIDYAYRTVAIQYTAKAYCNRLLEYYQKIVRMYVNSI